VPNIESRCNQLKLGHPLREHDIVVKDGQRVLDKEHCCASDRPDFDHELLY
jgi:hypothetical protein